MRDLLTQADAVISDCGKYRYRLTRRWGDGPTCGFIMLNPSTADAEADDPTIRRCISFAKREGCGGLVVVNLYAFRATKPADLWALDPEERIGGPQAEIELHRAIRDSEIMIAAWGADTKRAEHWIVERFGSQLMCLGKTKQGQPRHPLYVKGDAPLIPLRPAHTPEAT
ncbi:DUF1643 domain-containing protein [Tritonibacter mobilis]|uniref:DUF1643 domain-containing protein n=1 Tax=Tritonibacter mobilis TaxID=379347 RepID=UPI000806B9C5|nr:DUF1643 domain-containing protein [Tritonibacter mobilis]